MNGYLSGPIAIANAIKDMRALLSLDISNNNVCVEGTKLLAKVLESNQTMTSLNVSFNSMTWDGEKHGNMSGAAALADVIPGIGALLHFNISNNSLYAASAKAIAEGLKGNQVVTELNISGNDMSMTSKGGSSDMSGVAALADAIPSMGALSLANVMGNRIGKEMRSKLQEIMRSKPNLISLCGIADDTTEVVLSGLGMDADDAIILASELPDKRVLTSLNLASNNIGQIVPPEGWEVAGNGFQFRQPGGDWTNNVPEGAKQEGVIALADAILDMGALLHLDISENILRVEGAKLLAAALRDNQTITTLNISNNRITSDGNSLGHTSGVTALANTIRDMGALIKLDISSSYIGAEQERGLQRICVASGIDLAK
jgi:Ran GTPase-activating protein (RanGAP) involved in mRNA processing and transport